MNNYPLLTFAAAFGWLSITATPITARSTHTKGNTTRDLTTPTVFQAAGPNAASIQSSVDAYRAALENPDSRNGWPLASGHREINWGEGSGNDTTKAPATRFDIFLNTRASEFITAGGVPPTGGPQGGLTALSNNRSYGTNFKTFSPLRLFTPLGSNITEALFFLPSAKGNTRATVRGFGAVFTEVAQPDECDRAQKHGKHGASTRMEFFGTNGASLFSSFVPAAPGDGSLSFFGVVYNDARIARVRITTGDVAPDPGSQRKNDFVMMDDFIYGEQLAAA